MTLRRCPLLLVLCTVSALTSLVRPRVQVRPRGGVHIVRAGSPVMEVPQFMRFLQDIIASPAAELAAAAAAAEAAAADAAAEAAAAEAAAEAAEAAVAAEAAAAEATAAQEALAAAVDAAVLAATGRRHPMRRLQPRRRQRRRQQRRRQQRRRQQRSWQRHRRQLRRLRLKRRKRACMVATRGWPHLGSPRTSSCSPSWQHAPLRYPSHRPRHAPPQSRRL